jgi:hypothetical protein
MALIMDGRHGEARDPSPLKAEARYPFLHEGILRGYISMIGQHANEAPIYWKYGCWLYEETTGSRVVIDSRWEDPSETGPGTICFQGWGERARTLLEPLIATLQRLPVGKPPDIVWQDGSKHVDGLAQTTLEGLIFAKDMKDFFISYTKADRLRARSARQEAKTDSNTSRTLRSNGNSVFDCLSGSGGPAGRGRPRSFARCVSDAQQTSYSARFSGHNHAACAATKPPGLSGNCYQQC